MSFPGLMVHPVAIVTPTVASASTVDEYGHPVRGTATVEVTRAMIQPKSAREAMLWQQGGVESSDYTIFMEPRRISAAAYIRDEPEAGRRFEIVGIRSFEFGTVPHLEIDARLVGSTEGPTVS